jgi:hypothetical protein
VAVDAAWDEFQNRPTCGLSANYWLTGATGSASGSLDLLMTTHWQSQWHTGTTHWQSQWHMGNMHWHSQWHAGKLHFQAIAQADGMCFAVDFDIDVVVADAIYLALDLADGEFFAFVDFQHFVGGA